MFQDLDSTIEKLLHDSQAPAELKGADVVFETPKKGYGSGTKADVNLFLYEIKENRALRDPMPFVERQNNGYSKKIPPLRVDCSYLVTTWSNDKQHQIVSYEHMLLGKTLAWLSSFPTIPEAYIAAGGLSGQIYAPPTMVAQMDGGRNMGEFWTALGIPPRPYFNLVVTITMDLKSIIARSAAVTTLTTGFQQGNEIASAEERVLIGGRVMNANNGPIANAKPVADAWVRVDETGETQVTNELGQFVFASLQHGKQYTLRARVIGLGEVPRQVVNVPSPSGEYDIVFP